MNKKFCIIAVCLMLCAGLFAASEQDILKDAFADYSTPIVINYAVETPLFTKGSSDASFQEMTTIYFTNISNQTIKTITFEYSVYDESHNQIYKNKITSKNIATYAMQKSGVKNGKIEKVPLNKANTLRKKVAKARNDVVEITKISIQFAKGKQELSKSEIEACLYRAELDLYKDNEIQIKLQYNPLAKRCNIVTETAFENAYLECKFEADEVEEEAEDTAEAEAEDSEEDEEIEEEETDLAIKSTKKGSVYITEALFDESEAADAEMLLIQYLDADTADGKSLSAIQNKANRIIIDNEEKIEQVRDFAAILNTIM